MYLLRHTRHMTHNSLSSWCARQVILPFYWYFDCTQLFLIIGPSIIPLLITPSDLYMTTTLSFTLSSTNLSCKRSIKTPHKYIYDNPWRAYNVVLRPLHQWQSTSTNSISVASYKSNLNAEYTQSTKGQCPEKSIQYPFLTSPLFPHLI